jgi:ubiquinone/menaquinone biosynthesis C-methylase UbiE
MSLAFDRAAEYYDRTRALPRDVLATVTRMLAGELRHRGNALDVGVGTGRIALPLAGAGVDVVGVDLSTPMLAKLVENAAARPPVAIAAADGTRLPFLSRSFGGALACHLLHLVPEWRGAVAEMVRVVRPGGVVLVDSGESGGEMAEIHQQFALAAGLDGMRTRVGLNPGHEPKLDRIMTDAGATTRVLAPIAVRRSLAPRLVIDMLERNQFSVTWGLQEEVRRRAARSTRDWARERFGALDRPHSFETTITWRAYDLA